VCPSAIGSWYILNTLYKEVEYMVTVCTGAGRVDVLLTNIVTLFNIEFYGLSGVPMKESRNSSIIFMPTIAWAAMMQSV
jgi:hypothetical protein